MTDMDKMMIEKVAQALSDEAAKYGVILLERIAIPLAHAAISAYNPDDRLREALEARFMAAFDAELERRLYPVKGRPESELPPEMEGRMAYIEMCGHAGSVRRAGRAAIRSALSPLPQGDG